MTNTTTENEAAELSKEKSEEIIKDLKDLIYLRVITWKGFDDSTYHTTISYIFLIWNIFYRVNQLSCYADDKLLSGANENTQVVQISRGRFCNVMYDIRSSRETNFHFSKNRKQIGKVFPMGVRNYDANYDPMPAWSCGFQCVAIV